MEYSLFSTVKSKWLYLWCTSEHHYEIVVNLTIIVVMSTTTLQ